MSLRQTFFAGFRWTSLSAIVSFLLAMAQIAVLARFLAKSDFAWVALAGIFINTGVELQKSGINAAIIQRQETSQAILATLFWVNIGIGAVLFAFLSLFAPVLALVYESQILTPITILFGSLFLIKALSVQYKALLQKNLRFRAISIAEILGSVVGFAVACWLAVQGFGAYALVAGYLSRQAAEGLIEILAGFKYFKIRFKFDLELVKPYLQFSSYHLAERIVTQIGSQIDLLLIGKLLGADALGVYDIFKRILVRPFNLINDTLEKIAFPVLSQLQSNLAQQKNLFLQLLSHLTTVNLFLIIALVIGAEPLVKFYLGDDWTEHVLIFQLICGFCIFHYLLNPVDVLLLAQGKIRQWFFANLLLLPAQAIVLLIGGQYGLAGAVIANVLTFGLFTGVVYQILVLPNISATLSDFWALLRRPILIAFLAMCLSAPTLFFLSGMPGIFITLSIFALSYAALTFIWNRAFITTIQQLLNR